MTTPPGILELPVELILQIFSYLEVSSFLNLTSTCNALHKPEFLHEPSYWSNLVRTTFRVPNQPVVEHDGERWQKLFKRMLTQSRVYTWGNNQQACLGHSYPGMSESNYYSQRTPVRRRARVSWPGMMQGMDGLGVISDLQCGGWSTVLLNAKGALYIVGVIDAQPLHPSRQQQIVESPSPLRYPPGFPPPHERYEPSTAIRQFSAGRAHILGLSDSGRIWSWSDAGSAAFHVKFLHHDLLENGKKHGKGTVTKVVAGWNKSAALIEGIGIVTWEPLRREQDDTSIADAALVMESSLVPNTGVTLSKPPVSRRHSGAEPEKTDMVGEVRDFIVLEEFVLFNTHLGKVFVSQIHSVNRSPVQDEPVQLPVPLSIDGGEEFVTDVQGSFRSFAIFTRSGAVLTSKSDRIKDYLEGFSYDREMFTRIPALQNKDVIQLAFGDYHFHALHAPGHITSYGTEPQHCGALGLGGPGGEGRLRGLRYQGLGDARLVPHAYTEGRRIWFEKEKRSWIDFLVSGGVDPAECMERVRMAIGSPDVQCQGEVSEWIEQQGKDWEAKFGLTSEYDDGLGAYFALSVTSAGWHSSALVLVNGELADKLRKACERSDSIGMPSLEEEVAGEASTSDDVSESAPWLLSQFVNSAISIASDYGRWFLGLPPYNAHPSQQTNPSERPDRARRATDPVNYGASPRMGVRYTWADDHFPRLVLSDGTEMPGMVPFDEWRYPRPDWNMTVTSA